VTSVIKRPAAHTFVPTNPICVALDTPQRARVVELARSVASHVGVFKVGLTAYVANGSDLVRELGLERPVFLDLKLHDIPAQVEGAIGSVAATGASYVTIHASGGRAMLEAAVQGAPPGLAVLAVTVLTSLDDASLAEIGIAGPAPDAVLRLTELALGAGVDGLVCSPLEVAAIRSRFGSSSEGGPLLVVPGIRPAGSAAHDQRRTLSAADALAAGADIIVVGRPITAAASPQSAAAELAREIA
jgi:orotidine-5'-phosphate decarboxylase